MKTLLTIDDVTRGCAGAGAVPAAPAVSASRLAGAADAVRLSGAAVYLQPAAGAFFGKHADKRTDMARIDNTGWPPGPQDRMSG